MHDGHQVLGGLLEIALQEEGELSVCGRAGRGELLELRQQAYGGAPPLVGGGGDELGGRDVLESVEPEPGFGFLSFVPHRDAGDEPRRLIVPIGTVRLIEISAPDATRSFGFNAAP